jgi:phosphate transport system permease protein
MTAVSMSPTAGVRRRRAFAIAFMLLCGVATCVAIAFLAFLLWDVFREGIGRLSWDFINSYPSRKPEEAGIKAALYGTIWLMVMTAIFAVPVGIGCAIYMEEYAPKNWLTRIIQINIANLAGVPSIVYGILGLVVFVRAMNLERSVMAGALTISLLILPIIIIAAQEALRAVPNSIREGAYAVGATRSQMVFRQVVPAALPGMMTGIILALSRGIGETAPLIMIGALLFVPFTPSSPFDRFTVLPIQIFNWSSRPQEEFHQNAAAAIIVLLIVLLTMNSIAIILRNRFQSAHRG